MGHPDLAQHLDTLHLRHALVADDHVDIVLGCPADSFGGVDRGVDVHVAKQRLQSPQDAGFVVDAEHSDARVGHWAQADCFRSAWSIGKLIVNVVPFFAAVRTLMLPP